MDYKELIYEVVKKIPEGKVGTYGMIAENVNRKTQNLKISPRMVGRALHENSDPENVPCHRVVNSKGRVAESYTFGGARGQKRRLVAEGVVFVDDWRVDLEICLWQP